MHAARQRGVVLRHGVGVRAAAGRREARAAAGVHQAGEEEGQLGWGGAEEEEEEEAGRGVAEWGAAAGVGDGEGGEAGEEDAEGEGEGGEGVEVRGGLRALLVLSASFLFSESVGVGGEYIWDFAKAFDWVRLGEGEAFSRKDLVGIHEV